MRILIGSIALVDSDMTEGIVSPDYVVAKPKLDKLLLLLCHKRWLKAGRVETAWQHGHR